MVTFIISIVLLVAVLLMLVVLAQNSKGGGLTGNVAGATQMVGTRRASDWIEKATWVLAIAMFVLTLSVTMFIDKGANPSGLSSPNVEETTATPAPVVPSTGVDATEGSETDGNE